MIAPQTLDIPRAKYGLWMALATAGALALTWFTAVGMKGSQTTASMAVGALAIGSLLTIGPAVMRIERERWGVMVLVFGAARGLAALGAAYLMGEGHPELPGKPLYMGVAAGAILLLIVETALAVGILSSLDRRREALKAGGAERA